MKKNLLFIMLIPLMFACSPTQQDGVVITGIIENYNEDVFQIGGPGGSRDSVFLDESGAFEYKNTEIKEAGNYFFRLGNNISYLRLAPGMNLDYYVDMDNFDVSQGFTGEGADINNYSIAKDPRAFDYNWFSLPEEEFLYKADSLLAAQQADLKSVEKNDPNDAYWKMEEGEIIYSWANNLEMYPNYHPRYANVENFEVSEGYYNYRSQLGLDKSEYLESRAYESYVSTAVRNAVGKKTAAILEKDSTATVDRHKMTMETGIELISNEEVLTHFLTTTIIGAMQWTDLGELGDAIEVFKANVTDEESLSEFNENYEAWSKLSKGQPMFDFEGKDLEGNVVKSQDFRGKYLYVDVWATWCGPCKYEIPFLKELEADYHDRNIVFLSFSIDEDKEAWLKFVPENELGGVQIIGENAWESELCKNYKVRGVPTFMMFDPEGKIINVKMTRPSSQATRDTFDSYSDL